MTDKQPKPMRLAKILEDHYFYSDTNEAAAELRRLHKENADFRATCDHLTRENAEQIGEIVALKEQRDELLEALRQIVEQHGQWNNGIWAANVARAAIAKAGGAA